MPHQTGPTRCVTGPQEQETQSYYLEMVKRINYNIITCSSRQYSVSCCYSHVLERRQSFTCWQARRDTAQCVPAKQLTRSTRERGSGRAGVAQASGVPALGGSAATDTHRRQTSCDLVGNHGNQELRHKQLAREGKRDREEKLGRGTSISGCCFLRCRSRNSAFETILYHKWTLLRGMGYSQGKQCVALIKHV